MTLKEEEEEEEEPSHGKKLAMKLNEIPHFSLLRSDPSSLHLSQVSWPPHNPPTGSPRAATAGLMRNLAPTKKRNDTKSTGERGICIMIGLTRRS